MSLTAESRKALMVGTGCLLALAAWLTIAGRGRTTAQPRDGDAPRKEGKFLGASTCLDCHTTGPTGGRDEDFVLLTEYTTWRTQDKHSLAYFVLLGPRGQEIGKRLKIDVAKDASCLSCHGMGFVPEQLRGSAFDFRDGVSCDACHGPAEKWLQPHAEARTWRVISAAEKTAKGMNDLRDPVTQATVCLGCHVGDPSAGKVVTHAMYSAGHPPLPNIEIAFWSHNLPQHFRNKRDVPCLVKPDDVRVKLDKARIGEVYHLDARDYQQSQLVAASSLVGLRAAMQFVVGRSDLQAGDRGTRWPETLLPFADFKDRTPAELWPQLAMAQSDCYACHHELQRSSWRQLRGYEGPPGRPPLRSWPFALVKQGIGLQEPAASRLQTELARLHAACNVRPFGDPAKLVQAATALRKWTDERPELSRLQDATFDRLRLLRRLCTVAPNAFPDYESARQLVAAILVISDEAAAQLGGEKRAAIQPVLDSLRKELHLQPAAGRRDRIKLIKAQFAQLPGRKKDYLKVPGAVEALEKISDHGLRETLKTVSPAIAEDLRSFLAVVRDEGGLNLTEAILKDETNKQAFLDALHTINDREMRQAMDSVIRYDPVVFKQRLETLLKLLP